ncbi:MAG: antibiotic biosynthesis monooxygenase [Acidimicrobiales bacterium]
MDDSTMFVAFSEISVPAGGAEALIAAFEARLGKVEQWPGFDHLEVWHDERDPTHFAMVSWWAHKSDFSAYMLSDSHRRSHARIDQGSDAPKPAHFSRYRVVAR